MTILYNFPNCFKNTLHQQIKTKQKLSTMKKFTRLSAFLMLALLITLSFKSEAQQNTATQHDGQHDFDFNFGTWKTHVKRLLHPLAASTSWTEYDGMSVVHKVWNGRASIFELEVDDPTGHIEGVGLRLYNSESHQWNLNWTNSSQGMLTQPMIGEFKDGQGEFFDRENFNGRAILARNGFYDITPTSARFEQAFSADGGKTWETNWIMTFTKVPDESANAH
jgi:preprotein translocase subunit SecG